MAPRSNLYEEAFLNFQQTQQERCKDNKDRQVLFEFLAEKDTPEATLQQAQALKNEAGKKYGGRKVGDTEIPKAWIDNIFGNIGNVIKLGNAATKGAPESVGLAWYAVRLTLTAIQNNYDLYNLFGAGLSDISEIMIIIPHYDRLYDERNTQQSWKPNAVVTKLFGEIKDAYSAVLDFSLSIHRHLKAGFRGKVWHGIKDVFGGQKMEFQQKIAAIAVLKQKILEDCGAAFQERALDGIEGMRDVVGSIESTVAQINAFQPELERMFQQQLSKLGELEKQVAKIDENIEDIKAWARPKTPWEMAAQDSKKIKTNLRPMIEDSRPQFLGLASGEGFFQGTCEWVVDTYEYTRWQQQSGNASLLCITGAKGTGKSTLMSVITKKLAEKEVHRELLYVSCASTSGSNATNTDEASGRNTSVWNTLLYQLYELACESHEQDANLLESCNKVFQSPKSSTAKPTDKGQKQTSHLSHKDDGPLDFPSAFKKLADLIKVRTLLVIDDTDSLPKRNRDDLAKNLARLLDTFNASRDSRAKLYMLISATTSIQIGDDDSGYTPSIDVTVWNEPDIKLKLSAQLMEVQNLTAEEQDTAKEAIVKKAHSVFSYVDKAIRFMCEPFQRPIENHLKFLPEVGTRDHYNEELRKMGPNYARLLHRTLLWTVLGVVWPEIQVVMEDFNEVYKLASLEPNDKKRSPIGFPPPSQLDIEQLKEASGPFFALRNDGEYKYINMEDFEQIRDYCFEEPPQHDAQHADNEGMLCVRCRSEISDKRSLYISEKDGHLELAITCLRHLNNPLFLQRAGLTKGDESKDAEFSDAVAAEETGAAQPLETKEAGEAGTAGELSNGLDVDSAETDVTEPNEKKDEVDEDGYDSDESMDDEDRDNGTYLRGYSDSQEDTADRFPRYEVQYWIHHVRLAEDQRLWKSEERAGSESWAELFGELDKLVYENRPAFEAWQKKYGSTASSDYLKEPRKPLHVAAYLGLVSWAEHLISERGEDVHEISGERNVLQAAAIGMDDTAFSSRDSLSMLKLLLEKGVDVNAQTEEVAPAFHTWLAEDPSLDSVRLMIEHGADPTIKGKASGWTAMHQFANKGTDIAALNMLVSKGGDINAVDDGGYTPLLLLLRRQDVSQDLLKAFIAHKASVNAEESYHSTRPLQMASLWGATEHVETLLEAGIEAIDDEDGDGDTALHQAAMSGHADIVRVLAEKGANPSHPNKRGRTALHSASWYGYTETVENLIKADADIVATDKHSRTPFFFACLCDTEDAANIVLDKLLELKLPLVEINKPTIRMRTPLRQAATHGFDGLVRRLIEAARAETDLSGLAIDLRDTRKHMTALHRAASNGHVEVVKLLIEAGSDIRLEDTDGKTALVLAYEKWMLDPKPETEEIVSLLMEKDPDAARSDSQVAAICAANGSKKLLVQLRRYGADLSRPDSYGWTPLDLARHHGQSDTEAYLKQHFAWTGMLPSRWVRAASQNTDVSEDGATVSHTSKERVCINTDKPLPSGLERYYFEITLKGRSFPSGKEPPSLTRQGSNFVPPLIAIGFTTLGGTSIDFPGWPPSNRAPGAKSWGYHSDDGNMFESNNTIGTSSKSSKQRYWPGETVGCGVDLSKNTMWFTRDGKKLDFEFENVRGRLFPVLGLRDDIEAETNFFGPFKWADGEEVMDEVTNSSQGQVYV